MKERPRKYESFDGDGKEGVLKNGKGSGDKDLGKIQKE